MARGSPRPRAEAPIPCPTLPLPPRPASLPERDRAPTLPANFAGLVFLAVQGVGGEQHAPHPEFLDQGLGGADLVALIDLLMGQDERVLAGEGAEHLRRGSVVELVEAAAQRLAVQRDDPPSWRGGGAPEMLGVAAEGGLDLGRVERVQ